MNLYNKLSSHGFTCVTISEIDNTVHILNAGIIYDIKASSAPVSYSETLTLFENGTVKVTDSLSNVSEFTSLSHYLGY